MDLFEPADTVCPHSLLWQQIPEVQSPLCKHCICFKSSPTSFNEFPLVLVLQDLVDNSYAFTLSAIFMTFLNPKHTFPQPSPLQTKEFLSFSFF